MRIKQKNNVSITIYNKININDFFNFSIYNLSNKIFNYIIFFLKLKNYFFVELYITTNQKIRFINKKYRQIDKATDVLSFPNFEFKKPLKFNNLINQDIIFLGDIVISIDKVLLQSKKYNHSQKREFAFLLIHSILHLFGYDHVNKNDEKKMLELQNRILTNLGIVR